MREITVHRSGTGALDDMLTLHASDDPAHQSAGGTPTLYTVQGPYGSYKVDLSFLGSTPAGESRQGLTNEVLLAIVADRLTSFQSGPFACKENQLALVSVERAMIALTERSLKRWRQGIKGTPTQHDPTLNVACTPRLRIEGDRLLIESVCDRNSPHKLSLTYVQGQWRAWQLIGDSIAHFDPPLTEAEWALLTSLATTTAAQNGLAELRSAMARTRKVATPGITQGG